MMFKVPNPLTSKEEEAEEETIEEETEEFNLRETFTRRTVEFQFIRGGGTTITYDVFDGKDGRNRIEKGKTIRKRGDVRVERFWQVNGNVRVGQKGEEWEDYVEFYAEQTGDEITTTNVASRHTVSEREMEVVVPCERTIKIETDTGERVYEGVPKQQDKDATYTAHEVEEQ